MGRSDRTTRAYSASPPLQSALADSDPVGPINYQFLGPLSEIFGRSRVLQLSNLFYLGEPSLLPSFPSLPHALPLPRVLPQSPSHPSPLSSPLPASSLTLHPHFIDVCDNLWYVLTKDAFVYSMEH